MLARQQMPASFPSCLTSCWKSPCHSLAEWRGCILLSRPFTQNQWPCSDVKLVYSMVAAWHQASEGRSSYNRNRGHGRQQCLPATPVFCSWQRISFGICCTLRSREGGSLVFYVGPRIGERSIQGSVDPHLSNLSLYDLCCAA